MKKTNLIALIVVIIFMIIALMPFTKDTVTTLNSPIIGFSIKTANVQSLER